MTKTEAYLQAHVLGARYEDGVIEWLKCAEEDLYAKCSPSNVYAPALRALHEGISCGDIIDGDTYYPSWYAMEAARAVYSQYHYEGLVKAAGHLHFGVREIRSV
jgi:hypothetical protein